MKACVRTLVVVAALAAPAFSSAQESSPAGQAEMRTDQSQQNNDVRASSYGGPADSKDQAGPQQQQWGMHERSFRPTTSRK